MGRLFCNGKKGFCERVQGTAEECENVSCTNCEFSDGTGANYIDKITNYDRIRNMSIDEMAEFMRTMLDCVSCQNKMMNNSNPFGKEKCNDNDYFKMCNGNYKKCLTVCKKWLLQDVVENTR